MAAPAGVSMPDWLQQRALISPDRTAIIAAGLRWSFHELDARVSVTASRLQAGGVAPADFVAVLAGNSAAFAQLVHGVSRAGCVLVPLNVRLTLPELEWQLGDSGAALLVADEENWEQARDVAKGRTLLDLADLTPPAPESTAGSDSEALTIDLDALHSIIYTSGTTGRPKGAMLTYGNHFWNAVGSVLNLGLREDDCWLACMPLFHVGGLAILLRGAIYGIAVEIHQGFDERLVNDAIDARRTTIVSVVATMLRRIVDDRHGRQFPSSLRCILAGGGPLPLALVQESRRSGGPVVQTYGLSENASQAATLAPEDAASHAGSAGKPLMGVEVRIRSDDSTDCAAGEAGEIVVRGNTVMRGYLGREPETAAALAGGWLHTGDYGYLDDAGFLYVLDRRDDLIVSGGENIYPAEIEAVLMSHADVLDACVYGRTDPHWGQTPVAAIVVRTGSPVTDEALGAYCREYLAGFKVPGTFRFVPELPRNAAGKLMRHRVREEGPGVRDHSA